MATFSFPTADSAYNGGQPAIGRNVRDDLDAVRDFVVGSNLTQANFDTMTDVINFQLQGSNQAILINRNSGNTADSFEFQDNSVSKLRIGDDFNVELDSTIAGTLSVTGDTTISAGSLSVTDNSELAFLATEDGNQLAPSKTNAEITTLEAGSPTTGDVVFNSDESEYQYYNGLAFQSFATEGVQSAVTPSVTFSGATSESLVGTITPNFVPTFALIQLEFSSASGNLFVSTDWQNGSVNTLEVQASMDANIGDGISYTNVGSLIKFGNQMIDTFGTQTRINQYVPLGAMQAFDFSFASANFVVGQEAGFRVTLTRTGIATFTYVDLRARIILFK